MVVSRTEVAVGLGIVGLIAVGAWLWGRSRLRFEIVQEGPAQAVGVRSLRGSEDVPRGFQLQGWSTEGELPTTLFIRMPDVARKMPVASRWRAPGRGEISARLILPDGATERLDLRRGFSRADDAMIQLARKHPPDLTQVDVELAIPGQGTNRWRLLNLPPSERAYPAGPTRTEQGEGANRVVGRAWWDVSRPQPYDGSGVFCALAAREFVPKTGEACEIGWSLQTPYQATKPTIETETPSMMSIRGDAFGLGTGTPYAGYLREVRVSGVLRRLRVFDEWIDFGTVDVRPRKSSFGVSYGWADVEPDLKAPKSATTPSGLRLRLLPGSVDDHTSSSGDYQTIDFRLKADLKTLDKGLPSTFGRGTSVGVDREGLPNAVYSKIDRKSDKGQPVNLTWGFFRKGYGRTLRMRMKVRRSVVVEKVPFDLRLPLPKVPEKTNTSRPISGTGFFFVDRKTLRQTGS